MSNFAPVVPIQIANAYKEAGMLGNYHLLLAHDVVENIPDYMEVYQDPTNFIIMDNSVIELGHPIGLEDMKTACLAVGAAVAVLPDELLQKNATLEATNKALDAWQVLWDLGLSGMAVPQGETYDEWLECAEQMLLDSRIGYIGIPKNVRQELGVSRVIAIEDIHALSDSDVHIHLLGFSDDIGDDIAAARVRNKGVMGIDSAVPPRLGLRDGLAISKDHSDHSPRGDWWDDPGEVSALDISNVTTFRKWIK